MTEGTVHSIHVSDGGLPKLSRGSAWVDVDGVEGDRQRDLRFHGGPNRAVCLYSFDLMRILQKESHPIAPGTIGENVSVAGIDWSLMVPGTHLYVGDAELELTAYAHPCRNVTGCFIGDDFTRISQKVHPGWSRLYAKVLFPGLVQVGAPVRLAD